MTSLCCIAILLIQYVLAQYTTIWSDSMEQNNGWSTFGDVTFSYESQSCISGVCTRTTHEYNTNAWIRRSTDVSNYQSLLLKYSVGCRDLELGDACTVYYSYTSDSFESRIWIDGKNAADTQRQAYPNNVVFLPDASSANTVYIWLESCCAGSGEDFCYWDSVSLEGILISTASTPQPTERPSLNPMKRPSSNPSKRPSSNPTNDPILSTIVTLSTKYATPSPNEPHSSTKASSLPTETPAEVPISATITRLPTTLTDRAPSNHVLSSGSIEATEVEDPDWNIILDTKTMFIIMYSVISCVVCACSIAFVLRCVMRRDVKHSEPNENYQMSSILSFANSRATSVIVDTNEAQSVTIESWFDDKVDLPQYYRVFVQNGYDSFQIIKLIRNKQALIDIGIYEELHLKAIMREIKILQNEDAYGLPFTPDGIRGEANVRSFEEDRKRNEIQGESSDENDDIYKEPIKANDKRTATRTTKNPKTTKKPE